MDHSLSPFGSVYALIVKVKNNVFVRMIIKSLSQFYRMNEQRLGLELPIGSRGMGGDKNQPAGNNKVYDKNNERPRKKLNFSTPKECFYKTLHNFALAC